MHVNEFSLQQCQHSHGIMSQFPPANKKGVLQGVPVLIHKHKVWIPEKFPFASVCWWSGLLWAVFTSGQADPCKLDTTDIATRDQEVHGVCAERLFSFLEHLSDAGVEERHGFLAKVLHASVFNVIWLTNRIWQRWVQIWNICTWFWFWARDLELKKVEIFR